LRRIHGVRASETFEVLEVPKHLHRWARVGLDHSLGRSQNAYKSR
jgi:hypothetical protein